MVWSVREEQIDEPRSIVVASVARANCTVTGASIPLLRLASHFFDVPSKARHSGASLRFPSANATQRLVFKDLAYRRISDVLTIESLSPRPWDRFTATPTSSPVADCSQRTSCHLSLRSCRTPFTICPHLRPKNQLEVHNSAITNIIHLAQC